MSLQILSLQVSGETEIVLLLFLLL